MTSKADWTVIGSPVDYETDKRLFFDQHEWETIEAASAGSYRQIMIQAPGRLA